MWKGTSHLTCQDLDQPNEDSWRVVAATGLPGMFPWTTLTVTCLEPHVLFTPSSRVESVSHTYKPLLLQMTGEEIGPLQLLP